MIPTSAQIIVPTDLPPMARAERLRRMGLAPGWKLLTDAEWDALTSGLSEQQIRNRVLSSAMEGLNAERRSVLATAHLLQKALALVPGDTKQFGEEEAALIRAAVRVKLPELEPAKEAPKS